MRPWRDRPALKVSARHQLMLTKEKGPSPGMGFRG